MISILNQIYIWLKELPFFIKIFFFLKGISLFFEIISFWLEDNIFPKDYIFFWKDNYMKRYSLNEPYLIPKSKNGQNNKTKTKDLATKNDIKIDKNIQCHITNNKVKKSLLSNKSKNKKIIFDKNNPYSYVDIINKEV